MSTRITTPPDLTRTLAALAAHDEIDSEIADDMTQAAAVDFLARLDAAKLAIGDAFALDTSDRNRPEDAAAWGRHRPDDMRRLVAAFPPPAADV